MRQLGIEACIGTGFAGIFFDNARKNGLALPVVTAEDRDTLMQLAESKNRDNITIDIEHRKITTGDITLPFQMDDATRAALIRGGDETLDTLEYADAIRAFEHGLGIRMRVSVIK